jgi:hypothetical protein
MTHYLVGDTAYWHTNKAAVEHGQPVAVIDPEDYGQAQRLHDLIDAAESATMDDFGMDEDGCRLWAVNAVRIALREFANPKTPKPEEPTGLGAVVEDTDCRRWVRDFAGSPGTLAWYCRSLGARNSWSHLDVDEILSEGVPA